MSTPEALSFDGVDLARTIHDRPERITISDLPLALKVKQVAQLTNMSTDAVYESISAGTCPWPVLRVGRVIRIPRSAVLAFLGIAEPGHTVTP